MKTLEERIKDTLITLKSMEGRRDISKILRENIRRLEGVCIVNVVVQDISESDLEELTIWMSVLSKTVFFIKYPSLRAVRLPTVEDCIKDYREVRTTVLARGELTYTVVDEDKDLKVRELELYPKFKGFRITLPKDTSISKRRYPFVDDKGKLFIEWNGCYCRADSLLQVEEEIGKTEGFPEGVAKFISNLGDLDDLPIRKLSDYERSSAQSLCKYMSVASHNKDEVVKYCIQNNIEKLLYKPKTKIPYGNEYIWSFGFTVADNTWQVDKAIKSSLLHLMPTTQEYFKEHVVTVKEYLTQYLNIPSVRVKLDKEMLLDKVTILSKTIILVDGDRVVDFVIPKLDECYDVPGKEEYFVKLHDWRSGDDYKVQTYPPVGFDKVLLRTV